MIATRVSLAALGVAVIAYGAFLLYHFQTPGRVLEVGVWAALGVVLHDGVLAPLALGLGWFARRKLSGRVAASVTVAFTVIATTAVSGFAVLTRSHGGGPNHTLLDRNYPIGLLWAVVVICVLVACGYGLSAFQGHRRRRPHGAGTRS